MYVPFLVNVLILKTIKVNIYIEDKVLHRWFIYRGFIGTLGFICYVYALGNLPLSEANMIQMTTPIWVSLIAPFYLGEQFYFTTIIMIFICMIGLTFIMKPSFIFNQEPSSAIEIRNDIYGNRSLGYISAVTFSFIFAAV